MKLKEILKNVKGYEIVGDEELEVFDIASSYKDVKKGSLYIAVENEKQSGNEEIISAINRGAEAIVLEDEKYLGIIPSKVTKILVPKTNIIKAAIACSFFDNPSTKMKVVGVVGKNWRLETSYFIRQALAEDGKRVGIISQKYIGIKDKIISKNNYDLDAVDIQRYLHMMYSEGVEYVVLEVPLESVKYNDVIGCKFEGIVMTDTDVDSSNYLAKMGNISVEEYIDKKLKIFEWSNLNIVNNDDLLADKIIKMTKKSITYGLGNEADYNAFDINLRSKRVDYLLTLPKKMERIVVNIPGLDIVQASLATIAILLELGVKITSLIATLESVKIPGVLETVENDAKIPVLLDGAKSGKEIIEKIKKVEEYKTGQILAVLNGDDGLTKKELFELGETVGKHVDRLVVTEGNVGKVDPKEIADEILKGARETKAKSIQILDRKEAIEFVLSKALQRDIVMIFGMGEERFLNTKEGKILFDEKKIIEEFLKKENTKTE